MVERLVTAPEGEPVSLAEAKTQMTLESAEDDTFVEDLLIPAARKHVEAHCNRGIVQQTWEATLDAFPRYGRRLYQSHSCGFNGFGYGYGFGPRGPCRACHLFIELPHGQLATLEDDDPPVTSIVYFDSAGVSQTLATTEYSVNAVSVPGRVHLAPDKSWPNTQVRWDAVTVNYVVGWAADEVPEPIKQAILLLVSQMYEHRTPEVDSRALTPVLFSYEALLSPYRIIHL